MPSIAAVTPSSFQSHSMERGAESRDWLDHHQTDQNPDDADFDVLDPDLVNELRETMWKKFMEQSKLINDTDHSGAKVLKCFRDFIVSFMEPEYGPGACPVKFDGVSCWPETPPATLRVIPCFHEFNDVIYDPSENNATLYCYPNGTWSNFSMYNLCMNAVTSSPDDTAGTSTSSTIFYVGNSLSLVAVILALWIFISFKDLRCLRNTIHINLLLTYLLHDLNWIIYASVQSMVNETVGCSFYVAQTYFNMTNFMWMFVEGLYLYMLVVETFSVENLKQKVYLIIGWGVPFPIIGVWVAMKSQFTDYHDDSELPGIEGLLETCPLMPDSDVDWIHRVPVLFLLSTNIIFLYRIMWVLITKLRSANTVETQRYRKATKALLVLIPLLGLTYMLLIALPQEYLLIHAVLLSTQGFWVAVFYCFLNSEVQNSIRHHIERWKAERGLGDPRRPSLRNARDESPRPRSGCRFYGKRIFGGKRESLCSEMTTMTTYVANGYNPVSTHAPPPPPPLPPSSSPAHNNSSTPLTYNHCSCRNSTAGLTQCCETEDKLIIRDSVI